jgi:RHS repeat-associated protein
VAQSGQANGFDHTRATARVRTVVGGGVRCSALLTLVVAVALPPSTSSATSAFATGEEVLAVLRGPSSAATNAAQADAARRTSSFGSPVQPGSDSAQRPSPADVSLDPPRLQTVYDPGLSEPAQAGPVAADTQRRSEASDEAPAPPQGISGEVTGYIDGESVVESGSPTELVYRNADGTRTKKVFSSPAAFQDPVTKQWREFDGTPVKKGDQRFHAADSGNPTSFGSKGNDAELIRFSSPQAETVSFKLLGASAVAGESSQGSVVYREILPGVDLYENAFPGGVKEELRVYELPTSAPVYRFEMTLSSGLDAVDIDGTIEVRDSKGDLVFVLPRGVAWESNPASPPVDVVTRLVRERGRSFVELVPDWSWMSAPERVLPLTIDPQVFMGTAGAFPNVYDLYVTDAVPNGWYDTTLNRFGWSRPNASTTHYYGSYIKFGGVGIPAAAVVTGATFQAAVAQTTFFYTNGATYQGGGTFASVWRVTADWDAGSPAGPTWTNRPKAVDQATRQQPWIVPGALTLDASNWVAAWRSGAPNYGIVLGPNGPAVWLDQAGSPTGLVEVTSFESGLPPYLSITYTAPPTSPASVNPFVDVSELSSAHLQFDDLDGSTSNYEICVTKPDGQPLCVPGTIQTVSGSTVRVRADLRAALNETGESAIPWYVKKINGSIVQYSAGTTVQYVTMPSAPVVTSPVGSSHFSPLSKITISWTDAGRGYGVNFAYSVRLCRDSTLLSCYAAPEPAVTTSVNSAQLAGEYPANVPLYVRVYRLWGSSSGTSAGASAVTSFQISNQQPTPLVLPNLGEDGYITTNSPTLIVPRTTDPDGDEVIYKFAACDAPTTPLDRCWQQEGRATAPGTLVFDATTVRVTSSFDWAKIYYWKVIARDDYATSDTPLTVAVDDFTAVSNVSPSDGSLGGLWSIGTYPNGAPSGSVEASNGNVFFTETDVDPATVGIDIAVARAYNSLDFRTQNGFGRGWTYPLDMMVTFDNLTDLNATVLMADGRREFHGRNPDGSFARAFGYDNTFSYDAASNEYWLIDSSKTKVRFKRASTSSLTAGLAGVTDADGNAINVVRTGMVQTVTDVASGRSMTITWASAASLGSAFEHITSITTSGAQGATWTYTYSGDNLRTVCSPDVDDTAAVKNLCTTYNYGSNNKLSTVWSPELRNGPAWAPNPLNLPKIRAVFTYDQFGRVATQENGLAHTWTYNYAQPLTMPTTAGGTSTARFRATITDPLGNARSLFFDAHRRLQYSLNETAGEEWFEYNDAGFLLKETKRIAAGTQAASFATTQYDVNAGGLNTRRIDPNGATWQWSYNRSGRVVSETNPFGLITSYSYDADRDGRVNQGIHNQKKLQARTDLPGPAHWWKVNESSGPVAVDSVGGQNGTYSASGMTLGRSGSPKLSADTSALFSTGPQNDMTPGIEVPKATLAGSNKTFSLWFKTDSDGVLLSKSSLPIGSTAASAGHNPVIYVGEDGLLRARVWAPVAGDPIKTPAPVNDGLWHRVVFSVSPNTQVLWVDGVQIGSLTQGVDETSWSYQFAQIGTGYTAGWPSGADGWMPFNGLIDEVTVHNTALTEVDLFNIATYEYTTAATPAIGSPGAPPLGLVSKTTDSFGRVTKFEYDRGGDLRRAVNAAGLITEYTYDSIGRRATERTSSDNGATWIPTVTNTYDPAGRLIHTDGPPTTNVVTGEVHRLRTTNTWDGAGFLLSVTQSDIGGSANPDPPRTTSYHYDDASRRDRVTDALGYTTDTQYDAAGRAVKVTDSRGTIVETTYDGASREMETTITNFVEDPIGSPTVVRPVRVAKSVYDIAGRMTEFTDANNRVRVYTYDQMGWPIRVDLYEDQAARTSGTIWKVLTTTNYNLIGQPTQVATHGRVVGGQPSMLQVLNNTYDQYGRLVTSTEVNQASNGGTGAIAGGTADRTTTNFYDVEGKVVRTVLSGGGIQTESRWTFDVHGEAASSTVENGATDLSSTSVRDARGWLTSTTDGRNATTTYEYDAMGRATRVTLPTVSVSTVDRATGTVSTSASTTANLQGYNTFGELTEVRSASGNITRYAKDKLGRTTRITHPTYTNVNAPVTSVTPTEEYTYDAVGNLVSSKDRRGNTTTFDFDRRNRVVRQTDPTATGAVGTGVWRYAYDDNGNLKRSTDAEGSIVDYSYDALNRLVSRTELVSGIGSATGTTALTSTYTLDDAGRPTTECAPAPSGQQRCINSVYAPFGQVLSVQDANLNTRRFAYDGLWRQTKAADPMGRTSVVTYDLAGRAYQETLIGSDGSTRSTETATLDVLGRPVQVDEHDGGRMTYVYDNQGRMTSATQLVSTTPAKSITTSYAFDAEANLTVTTDGKGQQWMKTYNVWNLLQDEIDPSVTGQTTMTARRWTYEYDAGGLVTKETQPGTVTVTRAFDQLGRMTSVSNAAATNAPAASSTFGYDRLGRMTSASHPTGTIGISYNERSQIGAVVAPSSGGSTFKYDEAGRMVQRVDGSGTATYEWDPGDRLFRERDPLTTQRRTLTWNAASQVTGVSFADTGGSSRTYTYDVHGRMSTDVLKGANASTLRSVSYGYDPTTTRLANETVSGTGVAGAGTNTYGYDLAGRLTTWVRPGNTTTTYQWDDNGNRTAVGAVTSTYDERNRLLSTSGGEVYTWTPRGTMLTRKVGTAATTNYVFDGLGRMTTAGTVVYTYDAFNRPASRKVGAATATQMTYTGIGDDVVKDGSNTIARSPAGDPLSVKVGTAAAQTVLQDRHGDVVSLMTPLSSSLTNSVDYTPFGEIAAGTNSSRVGFQGDWTDPTTGFVNMGARWYSPGVGRFVSRDTVHGQLMTPVTLNRYTYANNDPVGFFDPDGHRAMALVDGGKVGKKKTQSSDSARRSSLRKRETERKTNTRQYGTPDREDDRRALQQDRQFMSDIEAYRRQQVTRSKEWEPAKDPHMIRAAHAVVLMNKDKFDTAGKPIAPDGHISKQDFEAVRDNAKRYPDSLSWAAGILLANDKDVKPEDAWKQVGNDPRNLSNYGMDLYNTQKKKGRFDTFVGIVKAVAGFIPIVGDAIDLWDCANGDALSCLAAIPMAGSAANAVKTTRNAARVIDGANDASKVADLAVDTSKLLDDVPLGVADDVKVPKVCHSFAGDTDVVMADGSRRDIAEVELGEWVLATDPVSGETVAREVTRLWVHDDGELVDVLVATDEGVERLSTTAWHPFFSESRGVFVDAEDLVAGERLWTDDGDVATVFEVQRRAGVERMFDLTVDVTHTYYVFAGDQPVLVHNNTPGQCKLGGGATEAADDAFAAGKQSGAAGQLDAGGQSFVDVSGSATAIHPRVQSVLDDVPEAVRKPWHGGCAEPRCVSQALDAGVDPAGGTMTAVQIGNKGIVPHGAVRPPCPSCEALRDAFGYKQ